MTKRQFVIVALLLCAAPAFALDALKPGDRVVIYGDSITEQRLYSRYLQQYVYCRYPDLDVQFFNAGWNGDRVGRALERLDRDVLALKPTVVTLFFGMNDGTYQPLNDTVADTFRTGLEGIVTRLQAANVRVIVYSPGCVDYDQKPALRDVDYNKTLAALADIAEGVAKKHQCAYLDVHHPMLDYQTKQKAKDPKYTMIPDGVHPDAKGHLVMARAMLPALAEAMPAVDAAARDTSVEALPLDLHWHTPDKKPFKGLPFWVEPGSRETSRLCGMDDFAYPKLTLKTWSDGAFRLDAGAKMSIRATDKQFAKGVPLKLDSTAGKRLHDLIALKENVYFNSWREVRLPMGDAPEAVVVNAGLMDVDAAYDKTLHALAASLQELRLLPVKLTDGENLAEGKHCETSDANRYGWTVDALTDGSWTPVQGQCFATNDSDPFPKTATIDLETSQPLGKVIAGVPPFGSTRTVNVSVSDDGKTFKDVGSYVFSLRKEERHEYVFPATPARYVRLTYADHYNETVDYSPTFSFTTEVEAYGVAKK